ncbi:MAG: HAD family hydrolase [Calditrichaeota bacterium]|nr:MAG: HAD family hydrolase [Calditrichota bacterium]MBL1204332.1 HAD family hydrolase [Calditrichota bacterium]NOG44161.1 HAD family hydrolase [Calditrichota bacterium]
MNISKFKHIIWDWNGTLLDDAWLCVDIMNLILKEHNLPEMTLDHYKSIFDFPVISYYEKLGFNFNKTTFKEVGTQFIHTYESRRNECMLHSSAKNSLKMVAKAGISQSVLSASKHSYLVKALSDNHIFNYFSAINGLDNHNAFGKEDIAQDWIKGSGLNEEDILLIGDTVHDLEVAKAINVKAILVAQGHQTKGKLLDAGATVIESLDELCF